MRFFRSHPLGGNGPDMRIKIELAPRCPTHFAAARRRQNQEQQGGARGFALLEFCDMLFTNAGTSRHGIAG